MSTRFKPSEFFWVPVEFQSIGECYEAETQRFGLRIKRWSREKTAQFWQAVSKPNKTQEDNDALGEEILGAIVDWRFECEHPAFSADALTGYMNDYPQAAEAISMAIFIGQSGQRQKNSEWLSALFSVATATKPTEPTSSSTPPAENVQPAPPSD